MEPLPASLAGADRLRVAVLADTHLADPARRWLPPAADRCCREVDVIIHAGDVTSAAVLERLEQMAPTAAVLGNNDRDLVGVLPSTLRVTLAGVEVAVVHDSGQATGRTQRLERRFPDAALVVFGHSHIPWSASTLGGRQLHLNPGSPTQRRRQPRATMAVVDLAAGAVTGERILPVD